MSKNEQKVTNEPTQKIEVRLDAKVDLRIDVDGVVTEIKPNNAAEGYSLKEMYKMCNTDIVEHLYLPQNKILIVDEEGALKEGRKINWEVTKLLAQVVLSMGRNPHTFIFGDAMLVDEKNVL